jgi:hypothetical protein
MKLPFVIVTAGVLALAACDNKPSDPKPDDPTSKSSTTTGATQTAVTTTAMPPAVVAESDLATPADFEDAAEKAISKSTYKSELASLETDIAKD